MNKTRRKAIEKVVEQLLECEEAMENIRDEEQEAYDNLPESLQDSEKGEAMTEWVDAMDDSLGAIREAIEYLDL